MSSLAYNKQKGTAFENGVKMYLRSRGLDTERLRLAGVLDEGDLVTKAGGIPYVLECKNVKRHDFPGWLREAQLEAEHYAAGRDIAMPGFAVVVKRPNRPIAESIVATYLSEWVNQIDQTPF